MNTLDSCVNTSEAHCVLRGFVVWCWFYLCHVQESLSDLCPFTNGILTFSRAKLVFEKTDSGLNPRNPTPIGTVSEFNRKKNTNFPLDENTKPSM